MKLRMLRRISLRGRMVTTPSSLRSVSLRLAASSLGARGRGVRHTHTHTRAHTQGAQRPSCSNTLGSPEGTRTQLFRRALPCGHAGHGYQDRALASLSEPQSSARTPIISSTARCRAQRNQCIGFYTGQVSAPGCQHAGGAIETLLYELGRAVLRAKGAQPSLRASARARRRFILGDPLPLSQMLGGREAKISVTSAAQQRGWGTRGRKGTSGRRAAAGFACLHIAHGDFRGLPRR